MTAKLIMTVLIKTKNVIRGPNITTSMYYFTVNMLNGTSRNVKFQKNLKLGVRTVQSSFSVNQSLMITKILL